MAKLILRQEAINDLDNIWEYTAHIWSENQADKYYGLIRTACHEIAETSLIGRNYDEIDPCLLGCRVGKHIVLYQMIQNDEVEVIRILHEQMDLKSKLTP